MKKTFTLITVITLLFALIGCNADSTPTTGSITVSIKDAISRTITSSDSLEAVRYAVVGTGPNDTAVSFELSESTTTWTNEAAIAGSWNFTATAYNASDKAIGEGSSAATVAPGKNTSVSIEVNEYQGKGTLTITLTGISSDLGTCKAQIYKLGDEKGDLVSEKDITEGSASFELDNGYYFITLVCETDKIAMPAPEAVRIMKGDNLSAAYTLNNPGGITANITNGIKPCPEMSITLNSDNVQVGSSVTATATITPGTYKYSWYVDGERQTVSSDSNSVDITFDWAGRHKVTCVAYDTMTTVIWSEEITVDVSEPPKNKVSFYSGNKLIEARSYTPGKKEDFPLLELGDGFTLAGWKAEGSDVLITAPKFSLPYSETEYKYYAYITTDLLRVDETGAVYGTDILKNSETITSILIPDSIEGVSITSIGRDAFNNCSNISEITISDSITSIGLGAFFKCTGLTDITIGNSVTSIISDAFSWCSSLTNITIPDSVKYIGYTVFNGCTSLSEISIGESVNYIGYDAFLGCSNLTSINVSEKNTSYRSIDGILFSRDGNIVCCFPAGKTDTEYTIPDFVITIGDWAFINCTKLTKITIGKSVTSIREYAFLNCSGLTDITIPDSVSSVGDLAFSSCSKLSKVSIGNSITRIGDKAFQFCSALTEITIPSTVTSIGYEAFNGCSNLTEINIRQNQSTSQITGEPWGATDTTINWDYTD